jgi:hypothetical protein
MIKTILLAAALALPAAANAVTVYDTPASTPGNQSWTGTLGLDFTVNSAVKVTSFGSFDSGKDGITSDIFVAIFDSAGAIISPVAAFNGTANPGGTAYVFQSITPFVLAAGTYQLGAWGYNDTDRNYNAYGANGSLITFDSFGGKLTATGTRYANSNVQGVLATNVDEGLTRYGAGTMTVANVPEPASWAMLLSGFALVGFAARRRQRVVAA